MMILNGKKPLQWDIGIDFGILNNRINGELDFYIKNTSDLLLGRPLLATSGYLTRNENIGKLKNQGS